MKDLASTKLNNTTGEVIGIGSDIDATPREKLDFDRERLNSEDDELVNLGRLEGMLDTIDNSSSIKSMTPRNFSEQIQVEDNGATQFFWIYVLGVGWKKASLS